MKILVVDDEKVLVKGIKFNLESEGYQVETGYDGEEAVELARSGNFDLIILDLMMPKIDGLQACMRIREFSNVPIIMLTARSEDTDKIIGFECGADDYITKPFGTGELLARVRALTRRKDMPLEEDPSFGDIRLDHRRLELCCGDECIRLGPKEFLVMECLLVHKNQIVPRNLLCETVWGLLSEAEYNNVEVYISFLRKKLRALHSGVQIKSIRNAGYYLEVQS